MSDRYFSCNCLLRFRLLSSKGRNPGFRSNLFAVLPLFHQIIFEHNLNIKRYFFYCCLRDNYSDISTLCMSKQMFTFEERSLLTLSIVPVALFLYACMYPERQKSCTTYTIVKKTNGPTKIYLL